MLTKVYHIKALCNTYGDGDINSYNIVNDTSEGHWYSISYWGHMAYSTI